MHKWNILLHLRESGLSLVCLRCIHHRAQRTCHFRMDGKGKLEYAIKASQYQQLFTLRKGGIRRCLEAVEIPSDDFYTITAVGNSAIEGLLRQFEHVFDIGCLTDSAAGDADGDGIAASSLRHDVT